MSGREIKSAKPSRKTEFKRKLKEGTAYNWHEWVPNFAQNSINERPWSLKNYKFEKIEDYFKQSEIKPIHVVEHGPFYFEHKPFRRRYDKDVEKGIAKLRSQSESIDRLWHDIEIEEQEFEDIDKPKDGDYIVVKKRKGYWPVGKYVWDDLGNITTNYDVMDPKYDDKDFDAHAKTKNPHIRNMYVNETNFVRHEYRVHGLHVMTDCTFRQLFFDMLFLIELNHLTKKDLMKILSVDRHLLTQLFHIAATFGMVMVQQSKIITINNRNGTFRKATRKGLIIASWGCLAKSVIIAHGRRNSANFRVIDSSDVSIHKQKSREAIIDRIHLAIYKSNAEAEKNIKAKKDGIPNYKDIPNSGRMRKLRDMRSIIEDNRERVKNGEFLNSDRLYPLHQVQPVCGVIISDHLPSHISYLYHYPQKK
jgi:hypothetical protein